MTTKHLATILIAVLLATAGLACGGSDDTFERTTRTIPQSPLTAKDELELTLLDNRSGDSFVRYAADLETKYALFVAEGSAKAGEIEIEFVNPQSTPHNLAVKGPKGEVLAETETVTEGKSSTTVTLAPGKYVVYCTLPGHLKKGMGGHLTVRE